VIPYQSIIHIDKSEKQAVYLQLANQLIQLIKDGVLASNTKLPSSRLMATMVDLHRKTVVASYDELIIQGWLVSIPKKGTYVHANLPLLKASNLGKVTTDFYKKTGFQFYKRDQSDRTFHTKREDWSYINDGINDVRLAPIQEIAQIYRSICNSKRVYEYLGYGSTHGNYKLREVLATYLHQTRGINSSPEQIMITRGSQMSIYLATQLLINPKDVILVGASNYISADYTFMHANAQLHRIPVDQYGIDTNAIEETCASLSVKAIYVTSHHHHPTTKTMSAERRLHLLNLAQQYNFAIIEDDYDYDFHYNHSPILPLASHDVNGHVIYIGSMCKTVVPAYRVGYMIAPQEFVQEAANIRRYIDRQGDELLELTFARFIKSGGLTRHINKSLKVYRHRRDLFVDRLNEMEDYFEFDIPNGGMAIWLKLKPPYSWKQVAHEARAQKLELGEWQRYDISNIGHNAIRLGFASYNEEEAVLLLNRLRKTMTTIAKDLTTKRH